MESAQAKTAVIPGSPSRRVWVADAALARFHPPWATDTVALPTVVVSAAARKPSTRALLKRWRA